ncbi:hypothetical protein HW132_35125 [Brasilonema sp. CT11]|nr:hypothetical protein [Brasilonema sp. CT11]
MANYWCGVAQCPNFARALRWRGGSLLANLISLLFDVPYINRVPYNN